MPIINTILSSVRHALRNMSNSGKYIRNFIIIAFGITVIYSFVVEDKIYWHKKRMLLKEDFKIVDKPIKVGAIAETSCGIEFRFKYTPMEKYISIMAYCNKSENWVLNENLNDYILSHEQGHFDIEEINARELRKKISNFTFQKSNYQKKLDTMITNQRLLAEKDQIEYDRITDHSQASVRQAEYNELINSRLVKLKEYYDPEIVLKFEK